MASWSYSDWITQTDTETRLSRLRLHMREVSDMVGREKSAGDMATSSRELRAYLADLKKEERDLAAMFGAQQAGYGQTRYRFE